MPLVDPKGQNIPLEYARNAQAQVGYKAYVMKGLAVSATPLTFNYALDQIGLDVLASMFVDNRLNPGRLSIFFRGSSWNFGLASGQQGFFPVIAPPGVFNVDITSTQAGFIDLFLVNKEMVTGQWPT